jgi:hypothetical protein
LRAWRSAIDFIGEQDICENGSLMKVELLIALTENRNTQNVRRQQIGRELDALERSVERKRQSFRQRRFSGAGKIFEQNMSAAGEGGQQFARGFRLALHDLADVPGNPMVNFAGDLILIGCHLKQSETAEQRKRCGSAGLPRSLMMHAVMPEV